MIVHFSVTRHLYKYKALSLSIPQQTMQRSNDKGSYSNGCCQHCNCWWKLCEYLCSRCMHVCMPPTNNFLHFAFIAIKIVLPYYCKVLFHFAFPCANWARHGISSKELDKILFPQRRKKSQVPKSEGAEVWNAENGRHIQAFAAFPRVLTLRLQPKTMRCNTRKELVGTPISSCDALRVGSVAVCVYVCVCVCIICTEQLYKQS